MGRVEVEYEILYHFGIVGEVNPQTGWGKEFNLVSWNGNPPKFEVRAWSPERDRCARITGLTEKELKQLNQMIPEALEKANELRLLR